MRPFSGSGHSRSGAGAGLRSGLGQQQPDHAVSPMTSADDYRYPPPRILPPPSNTRHHRRTYNRLVQEFFYKLPLTILSHRLSGPPSSTHQQSDHDTINHSFGLVLPNLPNLLAKASPWLNADIDRALPPPLILELYLDLTQLSPTQTLVVNDNKSRWVVDSNRTHHPRLLLERWEFRLDGSGAVAPSADNGTGGEADVDSDADVDARVTTLVRSLYTLLGLDDVSAFCRRSSAHVVLKPRFRVITEAEIVIGPLEAALRAPVPTGRPFDPIPTPIGHFVARPTYRANCAISVEQTESVLSAQLLGPAPGSDLSLVLAPSSVRVPASAPVPARNYPHNYPSTRPSPGYGSPAFSPRQFRTQTTAESAAAAAAAAGFSTSPFTTTSSTISASPGRTPSVPIRTSANPLISSRPQSVPHASPSAVSAYNAAVNTNSSYGSAFGHRRTHLRTGSSLSRRERTGSGSGLSTAGTPTTGNSAGNHTRPTSLTLSSHRNSLDHSLGFGPSTEDDQLRELIQMIDSHKKASASSAPTPSFPLTTDQQSHRVSDLLSHFRNIKDNANELAEELERTMLVPRQRRRQSIISFGRVGGSASPGRGRGEGGEGGGDYLSLGPSSLADQASLPRERLSLLPPPQPPLQSPHFRHRSETVGLGSGLDSPTHATSSLSASPPTSPSFFPGLPSSPASTVTNQPGSIRQGRRVSSVPFQSSPLAAIGPTRYSDESNSNSNGSPVRTRPRSHSRSSRLSDQNSDVDRNITNIAVTAAAAEAGSTAASGPGTVITATAASGNSNDDDAMFEITELFGSNTSSPHSHNHHQLLHPAPGPARMVAPILGNAVTEPMMGMGNRTRTADRHHSFSFTSYPLSTSTSTSTPNRVSSASPSSRFRPPPPPPHYPALTHLHPQPQPLLHRQIPPPTDEDDDGLLFPMRELDRDRDRPYSRDRAESERGGRSGGGNDGNSNEYPHLWQPRSGRR